MAVRVGHQLDSYSNQQCYRSGSKQNLRCLLNCNIDNRVYFKMLLLVLLLVLVPLSSQQCLTSNDEVQKVRDDALESLLNSELHFSADMVRVVSVAHSNENVFFSPTSVFRALIFIYFLAANYTEANLRKTLHLDANLDKLDYMGAYHLENYYQKFRSIKKDGGQMNLANRLYVDKVLKVQHCLKVLFSDELQQANFIENAEGARRKINQWVAMQTNNVIKEFLDEGSLSKNTQLILLNAAYFKGFWKSQFDKEKTKNLPFHLSNGTKVNTPIMNQKEKFKLRQDEKFDAEVLELPYLENNISMFILIPLKRGPTAVQEMLQKFDGTSLLSMILAFGNANTYDLSVSIPKFTLQESLELVPILEIMGVGDLFQQTADLSRLTGFKGLRLSDAIHKAKIKVNEEGTEAVAVTEIFSDRMLTPHFNANRPFAYFVYNKESNQVLFFGVFNSPP